MVSKEDIFKAVSTVIDPEVGFNLVEMGLVYDAKYDEAAKKATVIMTLSTRACPLHQMIVQWVEEAILREIPEVEVAEVELVWEPEWNISMASEEVRKKLAGGA